MAFGPNSTNPRERRSYVHSILDKAQSSGSVTDLDAAQIAIKTTTGKKAEASGFDQRLHNIALGDTATRAIVESAQQLVRTGARSERLNVLPDSYTTYVVLKSPDFSLMDRRGVNMCRTEVRKTADDTPLSIGLTTITDHAGDRLPHKIPTSRDGQVDAMAIRHLPAQRRQLLANSAERLLDTADSPSLTMPNLDDLTPVELATLAGFVSIWKECPSLDPRTWPNQFSD